MKKGLKVVSLISGFVFTLLTLFLDHKSKRMRNWC